MMSSDGASQKTLSRLLFSVSNHHAEKCGEPPAVDGDMPDKYVGYFLNEHGEQSVYTYDFKTGEAMLRMGAGRPRTPS